MSVVRINKEKPNKIGGIEFVGYTGRYPVLCFGILTLRINGEEKTFGYQNGCDYDSFWSSGGGITEDWCAYQGEWDIYEQDLPEHLREYVDIIDDLFNENVPYGCCGGCI